MHCAPAATKLWFMGLDEYGGGQGPQPDVLEGAEVCAYGTAVVLARE